MQELGDGVVMMRTETKRAAAPYEILERGARLVLTAAEAEARRAEFSPPQQVFMTIGPAGDGLVLVELVGRLVLEPGVTVMIPDDDDNAAVVAGDNEVTT